MAAPKLSGRGPRQQAVGTVSTLRSPQFADLVARSAQPQQVADAQATPAVTYGGAPLAMLAPFGGMSAAVGATSNLAQSQMQAALGDAAAKNAALMQALQQQVNSLGQNPGQPQTPPGGTGIWNIQKWESAFKNGLIPQSKLVNVGGFEVSPVIAGNLQALLAAARKAGVWNGQTPYATGTYRTLASQQHLWYLHEHGQHPAAVAKPGTSLHGWGLAIDFNTANTAFIRWLANNAQRFGLYNLPGEPWHYSVNGH